MDRKRRVFIVTSFIVMFYYVSPSLVVASDPLVYANNFNYLGAIKVPGGNFGTSTLSYGGQVITFNPTNNSLFITGNGQAQRVAEISLPSPVYSAALLGNSPILSTNLPTLNTATVLQNFVDITQGNLYKLGEAGSTITGQSVFLGGLLKYGADLIGSAFTYYDGNYAARLSHFKASTNLAAIDGFAGMYAVSGSPKVASVSFLSGFMSTIPDNSVIGGTDWQSQLGGPVLTGNGTLSVISRTSHGPAAFSFDPTRLGLDNPVMATPLLYYPLSNPTLGPDGVVGSSNAMFNATTKISGMVMVPGTKSVLFFGYHGIGEYSYGDWTADPTAVVPGSVYYDPTGMGNKGPHAYPYVYQVWAYNADDLAAAKTGAYTVTQSDYDNGRFVGGVYPNNTVLAVGQAVNPWNIKPYAVWTLPFQFAYTQIFGGGAAFDPSTNRLYISEPGALKSGCCDVLPLIHVFKVDLAQPVANSYKVSGTAMLLNGTVVLQNNGADDLTISATDRKAAQVFKFATSVATGGAYNVTVAKQPEGLTCKVLNGKGIVNANADIANIVLTCAKPVVKAPTNFKLTAVK